MNLSPTAVELDDARARLAYINQHREMALAATLAVAIIARLVWPAAVPLFVPALLAAWWVCSVGFVRASARLRRAESLHRLEFAYFLLELLLLSGLAWTLGAAGWLAVLFYCCTIVYANLALPHGGWITALAWSCFALLILAGWQPAGGWPDLAAELAGAAAAFAVVGYSSSQFARMLSARSAALAAANRELKATSQELRRHQDTLEELVRQRTRDLAETSDELRRANAELQRLNEAKSHFLSNVSHELRTPLTSIRSFSELLLSYPDEEPQTRTEFLEIIKNESDRLTRLVGDVLDLAKIEAGRMPWRDRLLAPAEVVRTAAEPLRGWAEAKGLELIQDVEDNLPQILGDLDRLVQVLTNLIGNALKFTDAGTVRAGARRHNRDVLFFVADTGPGIPPDDLEVIFEKFRQGGDALLGKPRGTGLGLSICREIAQHYSGEVWAESELGRGSTFYFRMKAAELLAPADGPKTRRASAGES